MENILLAGLTGFCIALVIFILLWYVRSKSRGTKKDLNVFISMEEIRSIGELVVFRMVAKEIVTAAEHWFGDMGKKYFRWLVSAKKMAMIFGFSIDFKYDLRSPDFIIKKMDEKQYTLKMPKCSYDIHIKDIYFYDEQNTKLLPWLLPDLINRAFGMGFSEEDKNRLVEEAKQQVSRMAADMVQKAQPEVQTSARKTLETISRGFGADKVLFDFTDSELVQVAVESPTVEELEQVKKR